MSDKTTLTGILVALPTPFTPDGGRIDADALTAHIDRLIEAGVHGLVPGGSTGEFTALTPAERKRLHEICVKAAAGRVPVVASPGAPSTAETVELSAHAAEVGADALMVVPPYYDAPDAAQLRSHLEAVHEAAHLPIVYYNIPAATGVRLTAEQIAELGDIEGVEYLKDTSGDAVALGELLVKHSDRITAFNGWDTLTFFGLASGATGSVWGAANVVPELSVRLWDALAVRGDLAEGRRLWERIWPVCDFLEAHHYAAAVKTGMELTGHPVGPVRAPFGPLDESARAEFAALLSAAGAI
ncbi:dihydrodipicolinate synthase family protein [Nocardiopsis sp. NPDC050513]|uniref:dihydrodipicolinate synthase family protein n=1 Tax=Nocardiopsis sp. NPDC050513 TaxID=3364338 RepID=UPI00379B999D